MTNYNKIAKNTRFLVFRLIIVTIISLYTSRVLLDELGIDDFGLYGLIGGIVAMFASLRGLFASSIQRFLNVEIGKGNNVENLKKIRDCDINNLFITLPTSYFFYNKHITSFLHLAINLILILIISCVYILILGLTKKEILYIKRNVFNLLKIKN